MKSLICLILAMRTEPVACLGGCWDARNVSGVSTSRWAGLLSLAESSEPPTQLCDYRTMTKELAWDAIGERVRQARLSLGLSQSDLAQAVGLDRTMIAKIELGKRRLNAIELVRLSSKLGVSLDYLIQPQPRVISHRSAPLTEDTDTTITRQSQRMEIVLTEWLREVRQLVDLGTLSPRECLIYPNRVSSEHDAREAARWLRDRLDLGNEPIGSMAAVCERAGQLLLVTDVQGEGASVVDGDVAVAVVSRYPDPGRRRAIAAHELGHLVLGDEYSSDLGLHASRAEREALVDAFAAEFLLPVTAIMAFANANAIDLPMQRKHVVELAARYRTSWSLALRQAELADAISPNTRRQWSASNPTLAEFKEAVGWTPQPDLDDELVPPSFAQAVIEAWRQHLITGARAGALMHGQITEQDLPIRDEPEIAP